MTIATQTKENPRQEIIDLTERVEQLEISNNITSSQTELLLELVKMVTEIPAGKQIFNRALNRQKLNRLRQIILPRRQKELANFFNNGENATMPDLIKDKFVSDEMKLIRGVIRSIQHRQHYEVTSAEKVREILTILFAKIHQSLPNKKQLKFKNSKIPLKGGRNA
jgi:ubiquinone biosynthesis protein COQ9